MYIGRDMKKKEKAEFITRTLFELFPERPVLLDHKDPYTLLIAVLLSARCTDARVKLTTPELFELADTPEEVMQIPAERVREIIRPCGLSPRKSESIVQLSKILVERFGGEVPASFEDLESLPGVGHKTASVVMSQAFGVPAFAVDTHISRLAQKWGLSKSSSVLTIEKDLKRIFPEKLWSDIHVRMVLYGRTHCTARGCEPLCPICAGLK